jgi:predicted ribosomally synthesized peptide with nif11-like leader
MRFLFEIEADQSLVEKVEQMTSAEDVIGLAAELGYSVSSEDLDAAAKRIAAGSGHGELEDGSLDRVSGGGPGAQGPGFQGPGYQGPGYQGPGSQGPGSQGPGRQGPSSLGRLLTRLSIGGIRSGDNE